MDAERPIIFEARLPGLCWHCGWGLLADQTSEFSEERHGGCNQWRVTKPVAVSHCRVFIEMGTGMKPSRETKTDKLSLENLSENDFAEMLIAACIPSKKQIQQTSRTNRTDWPDKKPQTSNLKPQA